MEYESLTEVEKLECQQWIKQAESAMIFGHQVGNLDREGLLAVVGCLSSQLRAIQERANAQQ